MSENKLQVRVQREVSFYDDVLIAVRGVDDDIYVSLPHLCDALGLDRQAQTRRIQRHTVLDAGLRQGDALLEKGGRRNIYLLRVDLIPLWLAGISSRAVRPELQPKIERYQSEVASLLYREMQAGTLTLDPDVDFDALLDDDSAAAQAYKMARAVLDLARHQLLLEARLTRRLDAQEAALDAGLARLGQLEARLGEDPAHISPAQASQLSQAVKAVALKMSAKTGRNEYGGVYGELYRRFEITSYKLLPADRFAAAMAWLTEWHQALVDDVPF